MRYITIFLFFIIVRNVVFDFMFLDLVALLVPQMNAKRSLNIKYKAGVEHILS